MQGHAADSQQLMSWKSVTISYLIDEQLERNERASRNTLFEYLQDLSQKTLKLKILLSFRPQEEIQEQFSLAAQIYSSSDHKRNQIIDDEDNQKLVTAACEILTITRRPLNTLELAWAIFMASEGRAHTVSDIDQYVDHGRFLKFMQPFGAYVDYDNLKKHQVELVPQSVKESIMTESVLENRRLQTWAASIEGATNETLFKQCIENTKNDKKRASHLILAVVSAECMPLIRRSIGRAQYKVELKVESLSKPGDGLIEEAIKGNHIDILECLLAQEGIERHIQHRNSQNQNMLAPIENAVHRTDNKKDSVPKPIIESGKDAQNRYESARILLIEAGPDDHRNFHDELKLLQEGDLLREIDRVICRLLGQNRKTNPLTVFSRDDDTWKVAKDDTNDTDQKVLQVLLVVE
ncbi:hypothetical protein MFRU_011g00510 [Monilinia fructicola]|nr:hypothetical protein MFRU_011g00510 [Monilinia fructicola]